MAKKIDLTGQRFGRLTVIEHIGRSKYGHTQWKCKCDCGNEIITVYQSLKNGCTTSCGCARIEDLSGKRFGRLTVIKDSGKRRKNGDVVWECKCDCGNTTYTTTYLLKTTQSCGCLQKETASKASKINLLGRRFGKLTVIKETDKRKRSGRIIWKCKCDCGNIVEVSSQSLLSNGKQSCGCDREGSRLIDLTGQKFNRLTVIEFIEINKRNEAFWKCKCDCGNFVNVRSGNLKSGTTTSCGCLQKEKTQEMINAAHRAGEQKYWVENTSLPTLNCRLYKSNTSGVKGVCWDKKSNKWRAYITFKKEHIYLGVYDSLDKAIEVRKEAEEKYFHPILEKYGKLESKEEPCNY